MSEITRTQPAPTPNRRKMTFTEPDVITAERPPQPGMKDEYLPSFDCREDQEWCASLRRLNDFVTTRRR